MSLEENRNRRPDLEANFQPSTSGSNTRPLTSIHKVNEISNETDTSKTNPASDSGLQELPAPDGSTAYTLFEASLVGAREDMTGLEQRNANPASNPGPQELPPSDGSTAREGFKTIGDEVQLPSGNFTLRAQNFNSLYSKARSLFFQKIEIENCRDICFYLLGQAYLPYMTRCKTLQLLACVSFHYEAMEYLKESLEVCEKMDRIDPDSKAGIQVLREASEALMSKFQKAEDQKLAKQVSEEVGDLTTKGSDSAEDKGIPVVAECVEFEDA